MHLSLQLQLHENKARSTLPFVARIHRAGAFQPFANWNTHLCANAQLRSENRGLKTQESSTFMRKLFLSFLLGSFCVTPLLLAQRQGGSPPDPATMVQRRVAALTALLSLTAAQQQQATTIFTNEVTASATL